MLLASCYYAAILVLAATGVAAALRVHSMWSIEGPTFRFETQATYKIVSRASNNGVYIVYDNASYLYPPAMSHCIRPERILSLNMTEREFTAIAADTGDMWFHWLHPKDTLHTCWALLSHHFHRRVAKSEGGQDGLLQWIFYNIGSTNRFCLEFGYPTERGSNTANLKHNHGFTGLLWDGGADDNRTENRLRNLTKEFITPGNIVSLLDKYRVPTEADFVSVDIDSTDLWVFRAILGSKYRPRVISVEYNQNFPLHSTVACSPSCKFFLCRLFGTGFGALARVGQEFGYSIVGVVRGLDVVFVRDDILAPIGTISPNHTLHYSALTGKPYLHPCAVKYPEWGQSFIKEHAVDYDTWRRTGNMTLAAIAGWDSQFIHGFNL